MAESLNNQAVRSQNINSGISWHHTMWLATSMDFNTIAQGIRALFYEASESSDRVFIDEALHPAISESQDVHELLYNLDNQGRLGWITKAHLPNRIFLENGESQLGRTSVEFWFYAETSEALAHKVNVWAHQQIQKMKANNPLTAAQKVVNQVAEVSL